MARGYGDESNDYFNNALSGFIYDVACKEAICHGADQGYTVRQIADALDFPMPYAKVQQAVWKHYVETSVILLEEPGSGTESAQYQFVKEQNKYGTTSFRRVKVAGDAGKIIDWKTKSFQIHAKDEIIKFFEDNASEKGKSDAYMSCDFGRIRYKDFGQYDEMLQILDPRQREYIEGLPWELRRCYHKLNERMTGILLCLIRQEMYQGRVYFPESEEQIEIVS